MQPTKEVIVRIPVSLCTIRPEHTELYGLVTIAEIADKAAQFLDKGQLQPIHIFPIAGPEDAVWIDAGVIRVLAAQSLVASGYNDWLYLNAIVDKPSTIEIKALLIGHNNFRTKTKRQKCNEALYLIGLMPLGQGKDGIVAPTTGKPFKGGTDNWIGKMVGLPEYVITLIRRAYKWKDTDPKLFQSLLDCELDNWNEMKRCMDNTEQKILNKKADEDEEPINKPPAPTPPQATKIPVTETYLTRCSEQEEAVEPTATRFPVDDPDDIVDSFLKREFPDFDDDPEPEPAKEPVPEPTAKQWKEFIQYERYKFYHRDSITMPQVATDSVQVVITSPPYWLLRSDYNRNGGLGSEPLKEDYIRNCAANFSKEMKRVLKLSGSLFINIGDTIRDGELQTIPALLCAALLADRWHLVGQIIWYKNRLMNNKGAGGEYVRLQDNTEMIYHFVQEPINKEGKRGYYYKPFIVYNEGQIGALNKKPVQRNNDFTKTREGFIAPSIGKMFKNRWTEQDGIDGYKTFLSRCKGDNEIIGGNGGSRGKEVKKLDPDYDPIAVMSKYLPVIPILECSVRGDLILDCMAGSGTVGLCAAELDRDVVQFDINEVDVEHSLNEYAAWYKDAYGVDPYPEVPKGTTTFRKGVLYRIPTANHVLS